MSGQAFPLPGAERPERTDGVRPVPPAAGRAEHLLRDEEIDPDGRKRGPDLPFEVHDDAVSTVAEGRWYASVFLADMVHAADRVASHLLAAASCYAKEHELMWQVWGCVGGIGRDRAKAAQFADPAVRRQIVPIIREARARDAEAADHLERALSALACGGPGCPPRGPELRTAI